MIRTYALVASNGRALALPVMTLTQAEQARDALTRLGQTVYVVNVKAE